MDGKRKQLAMQFIHLYDLSMRYQMRKHVNKGVNPYKGQGRVLAILKMQPEIVQKQLGYLLDISKQALAELLNKLEKKGYITRTRSEEDRRSFVIKLTDAGREAMSEENDESDEDHIDEFFDCLDDEEQENLIDYMERIINAIEEKMGNDKDDFASFFRERFFAKHRHRDKHGHGHWNSPFKSFWGFDPHQSRDFGGSDNDK